MAAPNSYSNYKTNVGRSVTKKWKEANQISYDGDDWGDDDDDDYGQQPPAPPPPVPASAGPARPSQPLWERQPARSFTNPVQPPPPAPSQSYARPSFDRGDDRRQFPPSAGFESAYPTTQRPPFPELPHDDSVSHSSLRDQSSLRSNTPSQSPSPSFRPGSRGSSRGRQYPPVPSYNDAAYAAPGGYPQPPFSPQQRRSGSSGRPALADLYQRHDSPARPDSRGSNMSARHFPPRKASLSQQLPPSDLPHSTGDHFTGEPVAAPPITEDKPIPAFIRPSDIYKQIPEALEKVRKSHDSSRPSLDSPPAPLPDSRQGPKDLPSPGSPSTDDSDPMRRLKPSLDTVVERKSEYGMDNLLGDPTTHSLAPPELKTSDADKDNQADGVSRHPTNASSVYTDRPDPVSASTVSRSSSMDLKPEPQPLPSDRSSYGFGLPPLGRLSTFGVDLGSFGVTPSASSSAIPAPTQTSASVPRDEGSNPTSPGRPLQHQSSLGYKTLVQTAFEQSQTDAVSSPSSSGDFDRSNSASTTDISPIIGHKGPSLGYAGPTLGTGVPAILEEDVSSSSRPTSTATLKAAQPLPSRQDDDEEHSFDSVRPGYRRPFSPVGADDVPGQESGSSTANPAHIPPPTEKGLPPVPQSTSDLLPPQQPNTERTTSEEWQDWQAQRKDFNTQVGLHDSETNTSVASSPISQPEPRPTSSKPVYPEVTDANSGRSTPTSLAVQPASHVIDATRPSAETRAESFRPAIPGGWQSFTNTPGTSTPDLAAPEHGVTVSTSDSAGDNADANKTQIPPATHPLARPALNANDTQQSTESIPTARPPPSSSRGPDTITQQAFAAAASAGNALAGSLRGQQITNPGPELSNRSPTRSEISSENEWDASSASSGEATGNAPNTTLISPSSVATPIPLSHATTGASGIPQSTLGDIPAPLRTSRLSDSSPSTRPPIASVTLPPGSAPESENDKLQRDIVQSLTPNSSGIDSRTTGPTEPAIESIETALHSINDHGETNPVPNPVAGLLIGSQPSTGHESDVVAGHRPSLPKRFSWETESEPSATALTPKATNVAATGSPSTPKAVLRSPSDLPSLHPGPGPVEDGSHPRQMQHSTDPQSPPAVRSPTTASIGQATEPGTVSPSPFAQPTGLRQASQTAQEESLSQAQAQPETMAQPPPGLAAQSEMTPIEPREPQETRSNNTSLLPLPLKGQAPVESASFRAIMNLGTAQERILAFNESRRQQSVSDGQLEGWLQSLNAAEYSELFASNGRLTNDATESGPGYRASPRRMLSESVGSRHIQEDGKKLIAKAGRFGGKAGSAAKGLFARGKEKMRTASSGEKVAH